MKHNEYEEHFETVYRNGTGCVMRHFDAKQNASDSELIRIIAIEKANEGNVVHILPELRANDPRRDAIFKNVKSGKNPDLLINGEYVEVKEPILPYGKNTLSHNIAFGAKQADYIIVNILEKDITEHDLFRVANGNLKLIKKLQSVEFRYNGKYLVFNKNKTGS